MRDTGDVIIAALHKANMIGTFLNFLVVCVRKIELTEHQNFIKNADYIEEKKRLDVRRSIKKAAQFEVATSFCALLVS